jgi:hypothetical protein
VLTPENSITSKFAALIIACRREPAPASLLFVTGIMAPFAAKVAPKTSSRKKRSNREPRFLPATAIVSAMPGSFRQGALLGGDSGAPAFVVIIIDLVVV